MTPTPAQIEAEWKDAYLQKQIEVNELRKEIQRLAAAAEVGVSKSVWTDEDADRFIDETIERCAQVAIDWRGWLPGNREPKPEEIAAAIRALKDA